MDSQLVSVAAAILWPLVVFVGFMMLRRELAVAVSELRRFRRAGNVDVSPHSLAKASDGALIDKREARILRALVDDDGREMRAYQSGPYRDALARLVMRNLVAPTGRGFMLTAQGRRAANRYLTAVFSNMEEPAATGEARPA